MLDSKRTHFGAPMSAAVEAWFGEAFSQLHPLLQQLHRNGGRLAGTVDVRFGKQMAGVLGRRIAAHLGIPPREGAVPFAVSISSTSSSLHWHRRFNNTSEFRSVFTPIGRYPMGYWVEASAALQLQLGVAIADGGWVWQPRSARWHGLPVPLWLLPRTTASKRARDGRYEFSVEIALPGLGPLLSYRGSLAPD